MAAQDKQRTPSTLQWLDCSPLLNARFICFFCCVNTIFSYHINQTSLFSLRNLSNLHLLVRQVSLIFIIIIITQNTGEADKNTNIPLRTKNVPFSIVSIKTLYN
jgi:hypothetical protein